MDDCIVWADVTVLNCQEMKMDTDENVKNHSHIRTIMYGVTVFTV